MSDLTLATVEEAFQQWRSKRYSRKEQIPEALWSMALRLYPQYKRSKICEHLHLSGTQLKRRLERGCSAPINKGFVLASHTPTKPTPIHGREIQLTLQGQARSMTLCFDAHALGHVLPHLSVLL